MMMNNGMGMNDSILRSSSVAMNNSVGMGMQSNGMIMQPNGMMLQTNAQ